MAEAFTLCFFKREAMVAEKPVYNSIIGNFMVYQDRLKTNLLQLFADPKNTERFSIFSVVCEASILAE